MAPHSFLILCYFIAFLDRVNAGFAALTMNKELGFTAEMFVLGVGIFFIGYFVFAIPSNLVLERVGAVSSGRTRLAGSRMPPGSSTLGLVGFATQPAVADGEARGVRPCRCQLSKVQREQCAPPEGSPR